MKKFIGTKTIEACPMSECDFLEKDKGIDTRNREDRPGYLVIYPDGYRSWSPKEVFEEAYHELLFDHENFAKSLLLKPVFPSTNTTILVRETDEYGGAHEYQFMNSIGFNDGVAGYVDSYQRIQFVKKESDGSMTAGIQSEQLLIALIDRHNKLNNKFPSREGAIAITKMEEALLWLEARVKERIRRGVMGELKK